MNEKQRRLILIAGIPGTGKTSFGESFAEKYGFTHYDLEQKSNLQRLFTNPTKFIAAILQSKREAVLTWGFFPNEQQIGIVQEFRRKGFKLVWFDGNRPAALRAFISRGTVPVERFDKQLRRIDDSNVIGKIAPLIINTFDEFDQFKEPAAILDEIACAK